MDQFNFGKSTLNHLAHGRWDTKQGGGVHHASAWMGLRAMELFRTMAIHEDMDMHDLFVDVGSPWAPTCRYFDMPATQTFTTDRLPGRASPSHGSRSNTPATALIPFPLALQAYGNISFY